MNDIEIIVIGGSAGALAALLEILPSSPTSSPICCRGDAGARVLATGQIVGFLAMLGGTILRHETSFR